MKIRICMLLDFKWRLPMFTCLLNAVCFTQFLVNSAGIARNSKHELEIFKLQGPKNISVQKNREVKLPCHLLISKTGRRELRFVPWQAAMHYRLSVQWKIDGFGYANDTLMDSFGGRYRMPGPIDKGIFDLEIRNSQTEDQANFTCQVTIQTFRPQEAPTVKTLTSETARVSFFIPPERLEMWQIATDGLDNGAYNNLIDAASSPVDPISPPIAARSTPSKIDASGTEVSRQLQADIPSNPDYVSSQQTNSSGQNLLHVSPTPLPRSSSSRVHQVLSDLAFGVQQRNHKRSLINGEEMWAFDGAILQFECASAPSSPPPVLMWIISESGHYDPLDSRPSMFSVNRNDVRFSSDNSNRKYPKWKYTFDAKDANRFEFQMQTWDYLVKNETRVGISTLSLTAKRSLSGRRLECLIKNADAFYHSVLPKVSVILQVVFAANLQITNSVSLNPEFTEDQIVHFHCSADSNPQDLRYIWTIRNPEETSLDSNRKYTQRAFPAAGQTGQLEQIQNGFSYLIFDADEKEISNPIQTSSTLELKMSRSMHGQTLRCWIGANLKDLNLASVGHSDLPVWKHTSLVFNVFYKPTLQGPNYEIEAVSIGESVQLICIVDANPVATVTWYRYSGIKLVNQKTFGSLSDNATGYGIFSPLILTPTFLQSFWSASMANSDYFKISSSPRFNTETITIKSYNDYALYICTGDADGQASVRKISIIGESGPPKIQSNTKVYGRAGNQEQITCKVLSLPRPKPHQFHWTFRSNPIISHDAIRIEQEDSITGATSILKFNRLSEGQFGTYNCTVIMPLGTDSMVITLLPADEIPYAIALGLGAALVVAVSFAIVVIFILRKSSLQNAKKTSRVIITATSDNNAGLTSTPMHKYTASFGSSALGQIHAADKRLFSELPFPAMSGSACMQLYESAGVPPSPFCGYNGRGIAGDGGCNLFQVVGSINVVSEPIHLPVSGSDISQSYQNGNSGQYASDMGDLQALLPQGNIPLNPLPYSQSPQPSGFNAVYMSGLGCGDSLSVTSETQGNAAVTTLFLPTSPSRLLNQTGDIFATPASPSLLAEAQMRYSTIGRRPCSRESRIDECGNFEHA